MLIIKLCSVLVVTQLECGWSRQDKRRLRGQYNTTEALTTNEQQELVALVASEDTSTAPPPVAYELYHAGTDTKLQDLVSGTEIPYTGIEYSVKAIPTSSDANKVVFSLSGPYGAYTRTEWGSPFFLFGDKRDSGDIMGGGNGKYLEDPGIYTITVEVFLSSGESFTDVLSLNIVGVAYELYHAGTNVKLQDLVSGMEIAYTDIAYSVKAIPIIDDVPRITFALSGPYGEYARTEWGSPFFLFGDKRDSGDVMGGGEGKRLEDPGSYTIDVEVFLSSGLSFTDVLSFTIVGGAAPNSPTPEPTPTVPSCDGASFIESGGQVVMEIESLQRGDEWELATSIPGFTGDGYYVYAGDDHFNDPGQFGLMEASFKITAPGTFLVRWRTYIGPDEHYTENNDSWLKISGEGATYFGRKQDSETPFVFPRGAGYSGPYPNGSGGAGFFKVFRNAPLGKWDWKTATSDHSGHDVLVTFAAAGVFKVSISARSHGHALDRLVLYRLDDYDDDLDFDIDAAITTAESYIQDLTTTETACP